MALCQRFLAKIWQVLTPMGWGSWQTDVKKPLKIKGLDFENCRVKAVLYR